MIKSVVFDASENNTLPLSEASHRLIRIRFSSCPGSDLSLFVTKDNDGHIDAHGVPQDAWWVIRCSDLPDRTTRLTKGSHSLRHLLSRYGFMDGQGCVNHRKCIIEYARRDSSPLPQHALKIPREFSDVTGIPQFHPNSGVCWYASMCWATFCNADVAQMITNKLPEDLKQHSKLCLHSRDAAQKLRNGLWYQYAIGDNVEDPPEMDGRNGFTEFSVLCASLGIPIITLREENGRVVSHNPSLKNRKGKVLKPVMPKANEQHLLALRFVDADHDKFPIARRIDYKDNRYRLVSMYMGQRKCGHQISAATPTTDWRMWSLTDADLHKDGIGPIYVYFEGKKWRGMWWKAWHHIVHVTKFGNKRNEFCNLSPHNPNNSSLDRYRSSNNIGSCSVDAVYLSA